MSPNDPLSPTIKSALEKVEEELAKVVLSGSRSLTESSLSTLRAGGKRLRPALVLVSGLSGRYSLEALLPAALAVELIHMASLIHDDILDEAKTRRGLPTVNHLKGNREATATGDFLFATAFLLLSKAGNIWAIEIISKASLALSLGELWEVETAFSAWQSLNEYLTKVRNKTAALFAASCEVGALLSGSDEKEVKALRAYGEYLGMAFQIFDDILDFSGKEENLGKGVETDLKEGVITMPLLYALQEEKIRSDLIQIIENPPLTEDKIRKAREMLYETDALEKSKKEAANYVSRALAAAQQVSNQEARKNLTTIGNFVIERHH